MEDDIYSLLPETRLPPLAALAPERACYLLGVAKSIAAGMKIAYVVAPSADRAGALFWPGVRATFWMSAPISAAVMTRMIENGAAWHIIDAVRVEMQARHRLLRPLLSDIDAVTADGALHLWIRLPNGTSAQSLRTGFPETGQYRYRPTLHASWRDRAAGDTRWHWPRPIERRAHDGNSRRHCGPRRGTGDVDRDTHHNRRYTMIQKSRVWTDVDLNAEGIAHGYLRVPFSSNESGAGWIPVPIAVVKNGVGPSVLLMAGNHGDEYEGQVLLMKFLRSLSPELVKGWIIILPGVNGPADEAGNRVSPIDGGNLNRLFPGDADGTPTQMIAHHVVSVLLSEVRYCFDFHSGGNSLEFIPAAHLVAPDEPELRAEPIGFLKAFGMFNSILIEGLMDGDQRLLGSCRRLGVGHMSTELGGGGRLSLRALRAAERGLSRLLNHVGVLAHEADEEPAPSSTFYLRHPTRDYVYSTANGIFESFFEPGDTVADGEVAGVVRFTETPWREPEVIRFGKGGTVLLVRAPARTKIGDALFRSAPRSRHPSFDRKRSFIMNKILRGFAAVCFSLAVSSASARPITLNVLVQASAGPYRAIAEAFEKDNPDIRIDIGTPIQTYEEILQRTLRGIMIGDAPDVAFQGFNLMRQAAEAKAMIDLTVFAADPTLAAEGYDHGLSPLCTVKGQLMGLPFAMSVPVLFFNADLVKRAGGDPDAFPNNWDGIIALAERIRSLGPGVQGINFRYSHSGNWSFQALVTSAGGKIMGEDDRTIAFNGSAGLGALGLFKNFVDKGGMVDLSPDQARQAFLAGAVGIMSDSSAFLETVSKGAQGKFTLRTAGYPLARDIGRLPPGGNCATIATNKPNRQKAAWEFVKYAVGPKAQAILAQQTGYLPVNRTAAEKLEEAQQDPALKTNMAVIRRQLSHLTQWYGFPPPNSGKITDAIQSRIQSVVSTKARPEEAMRAMVSDVQTLLGARPQ
ncbi:extracellular solute-binding protein [Bradyrhizobium centrosematis]|nr:extracellular solute-binding protein [Bradyrhizobium centrosematis]